MQTLPQRELVLKKQNKQKLHSQLGAYQKSGFHLCLNCKCHIIKFKVSVKGCPAGSVNRQPVQGVSFIVFFTVRRFALQPPALDRLKES